jgi:Exopolyphosphatase-related proteins
LGGTAGVLGGRNGRHAGQEKLGVPLVGLLGEYVYLALISDTGDFCFNNTRPETLEMAAEILRQGLLPGPFHEQKQSTGTINQLQMRGTVLKRARLHADGRISLIAFTRELFEQTGTGPEDTEGLVNTVLYVRGVQVAISLREEEQGIKFSLRSKAASTCRSSPPASAAEAIATRPAEP